MSKHSGWVKSWIAMAALSVACCGQAQITNGGFETGDFTGWQSVGDTQIETSSIGSGPTQGTYQALIASATDGSVNPAVAPGIGTTETAVESLLNIPSGWIAAELDSAPVLTSAIAQTVSMRAGQRITFDWDFLTNQTYNDGTSDSIPPSAANNDFCFFSFSQPGSTYAPDVVKLADTFYGYASDPSAPGGFDTGFTITPSDDPFISETGYHSYTISVDQTGVYTLGFGVTHVAPETDDGVNSALLIDNVQAVPEPSVLIVSGVGAIGLGIIKRRRSR